jgi:hypothetical protein
VRTSVIAGRTEQIINVLRLGQHGLWLYLP